MRKRHFSAHLVAFIAWSGLLIVGGCDGGADATDSDTAVSEGRYYVGQCPHTWSFGRGDSVQSVKGTLIKLTDGHVDVPEYNDCQRFIVGDSTAPRYDSIFAIFETQIGTLEARLRELHLDTAEARGVSAAVIYAENDYAPLSIVTGFNCVVVKQSGSSPNSEWQAFMRPVRGPEECDGAVDVAGAPRLHVVRTSGMGTHPADAQYYPPVARWGFNRGAWEQYIILTCGVGTCFVGGPSILVPDGPPLPTGTNPGQKMRARVYVVQGWFDAQPLARRVAGGGLVPQLNAGLVIPDFDLGTRNSVADFAGWVPVARVQMAATDSTYLKKFNFSATTRDSVNVVEACARLQAGDCPGGETLTCKKDPHSGGAEWLTRITSARGGDPRYMCARREETAVAGGVAATARWRWLNDDETLWFRCMSGCCTVAD